MKLRACVTVALMDGEERALRDILPYLYRRVDPAMAVRAYLLAFNRRCKKHKTDPPLEYQIRKGKYRVVAQCLIAMRAKGLLRISRPEGDRTLGQARLRLTEEGLRTLRMTKRNSKGRGVWQEFRRAYVAGLVGVHIRLLDEPEGAEAVTGPEEARPPENTEGGGAANQEGGADGQ